VKDTGAPGQRNPRTYYNNQLVTPPEALHPAAAPAVSAPPGAPAAVRGGATRRLLRSTLVLCVLGSCVGCDQAVKHLVQGSLAASPPVSLLHGMVRFELARNRGAFLSFGEELPDATRYLLFVVLVGGVLLATLAFTLLARGARPLQLLALSLLTGGGAGNLIDRLAHDGAVVDFVSVGIGPLRTGIFNLADAAITLGFVLLLLSWRDPLFVRSPAPADPPGAAAPGR
jgi:signal peptidase II